MWRVGASGNADRSGNRIRLHGTENSVYQYPGGPQVHRRVTTRRQYSDGGTGSAYELKQVITPAYSGDGTASQPFKTQTIVEQTDAAGNLLTKEKHYFEGSPTASLESALTRHSLYSGWMEGRETKTEVFDTNGVALRTSESFYAQRAAIAWWSTYASTRSLTDNAAPPNDPQNCYPVILPSNLSAEFQLRRVRIAQRQAIHFHDMDYVRTLVCCHHKR